MLNNLIDHISDFLVLGNIRLKCVRKLEMVMKECGFTKLDTMEIGSMTALKSYVESELGIALVPKILGH